MPQFDVDWHQPPYRFVLADDEVHIWRASLSQPLPVVQLLRRFLQGDELAKAERFYFERDRQHFIVARGLLRVLLARYLGFTSSVCGQLHFAYNAYGKPALASAWHKQGLNFNLSHSRDVVLLAFSYGRELGIDVEYMRMNVEYESLATHYFSELENTMLQALSVQDRQSAFFACWTRKEAYIKARGRGLSLPLDSFDVSLRADEPAALLDSREDPCEITRWSLHTLNPGPGYAGALAVEGQFWRGHCWQVQMDALEILL